MRIKKIEIIPVSIPFFKTLKAAVGDWGVAEFVIIRMYTDAGIVGLGEVPPFIGVSRISQGAIVEIIRRDIAPVILGLDPFQVEKAWDLMDKAAPGNAMAATPIDMAMFDIMGKALKTPVYNLLGGIYQEKVPIAGLVGMGSTEEMATDCQRWVDMGAQAVRIKIGLGLQVDIQNAKAARKVIGDKIKLRADCNQAFNRNEAIKAITILDDESDLELVEQPVAWHDLKGMGIVARAVNPLILPHETLLDRFDAMHLIEYEAAGVFGIKLDRPGGFVNAKKVCGLAELANIPCFVSSSVELGVSTAAAAHLAVSQRVVKLACEFSGPQMITDDIVRNPIPVVDGFARPWDEPGLGIELDDAKVEKYSGKIVICE